MEYEVYIASYNDVVLYVGEGKIGRSDHVNSGISHVFNLNRFLFQYGHMDIDVLELDTKEQAEIVEYYLIEELEPCFNSRYARRNIGKNSDDTFYLALGKIEVDEYSYEKRLLEELKQIQGEYKKLVKVVGRYDEKLKELEASLTKSQCDILIMNTKVDGIISGELLMNTTIPCKDRAMQLLDEGYKKKEVAEMVGVSTRTITRWGKLNG